MLHDLINYPDQLSIDDISSPISAQIFNLCDPELFPETLQNSEVTSCSNCCYEENSSYASIFNIPQDVENSKLNSYQDINGNTNTTGATTTVTGSMTSTTTTTTTNTTTPHTNNNSNLSILFDSQEEMDNDIAASIDFTSSPTFSVLPFLANQAEQFDFSSMQSQIPLSDIVDRLSHYRPDHVATFMGPPLPPVFEEDCLSSVPSYLPMNPTSTTCSLVGPPMGPYIPGTLNAALSAESSMFAGSLMMGSEMQTQELDFQGDNGGIYCPDSLQQVLNAGDLQALTNESQQLVARGANSTPLASDISVLDDSSFKVGKLSVEQRKEKILRYMKKRNERNFSKKIKYACRKTLADSRPRVRGRFAKNDDFGENHRPSCSHHDEDDEEEVVVKEEEEMVDSSDILAHISGVNSFKCNYPIQSWI